MFFYIQNHVEALIYMPLKLFVPEHFYACKLHNYLFWEIGDKNHDFSYQLYLMKSLYLALLLVQCHYYLPWYMEVKACMSYHSHERTAYKLVYSFWKRSIITGGFLWRWSHTRCWWEVSNLRSHGYHKTLETTKLTPLD